MKLSNLDEKSPTEASLTRVWKHANSKRPFAIIAAVMDEYSLKENISINKALAQKIRKKGYGYFFLEGHWIENKDTEDETPVKETSIFVVGEESEKGDDTPFLKEMVAFSKEYKQDGVLVKTSDGVKIYDKAGKETVDVGKLRINKAGETYSKLRRAKNKTFIFEREIDGPSWISKLVSINKAKAP